VTATIVDGAARITDIDLSFSATYSFRNRAPGWLETGAPNRSLPTRPTLAAPSFPLRLTERQREYAIPR
jgi:hypothetical protein